MSHFEQITSLRSELNTVIVGQEKLLDRMIVALLAGGHVLLEGPPGVAKTTAVHALASSVHATFQRVQFTPDLMPGDLTGSEIYDGKGGFHFSPGPLFHEMVLADEINRAPAKTQSALLQAMQERTVTIDRKTHKLPENFTVFATQNPIEYEGTYPLPEAQKDRFMLKITMDHPKREDELTLAKRMLGKDSPEATLVGGTVKQILTPEVLMKLRSSLEGILVKEELIAYIVDMIRKTRKHQSVMVGAGPRATQSLLLASRTFAAIKGRDFVTPDDIKSIAAPVLEHRLILRPEYEIEGLTVREVIENILKDIAVPR